MARAKILITIKTYPVPSSKYIELACTAGLTEDGSWIRIFPIPFRFLDGEQQFSKYQWIEADIEKSTQDHRPESHKIVDIDNISLLEKVSTGKKRDWSARNDLILNKLTTHTHMQNLIDQAKRNDLSLALFKPAEIVDFIAEPCDSEWDEKKVSAVSEALKQGSLFDDEIKSDFKNMPKLPFKFSYKFKDETGKQRRLMIEDWEVGALYWNCYKKSNCQKTAIEKVKDKYLDEFLKKDLHFFLGTTKEWHDRAPNPFVIIGTYTPPIQDQYALF